MTFYVFYAPQGQNLEHKFSYVHVNRWHSNQANRTSALTTLSPLLHKLLQFLSVKLSERLNRGLGTQMAYGLEENFEITFPNCYSNIKSNKNRISSWSYLTESERISAWWWWWWGGGGKLLIIGAMQTSLVPLTNSQSADRCLARNSVHRPPDVPLCPRT